MVNGVLQQSKGSPVLYFKGEGYNEEAAELAAQALFPGKHVTVQGNVHQSNGGHKSLGVPKPEGSGRSSGRPAGDNRNSCLFLANMSLQEGAEPVIHQLHTKDLDVYGLHESVSHVTRNVRLQRAIRAHDFSSDRLTMIMKPVRGESG